MKTALILGAAAIAVYIVWQHGAASAQTGSAVASAPLAPGNIPYSPPPPPNPATVALLQSNALSAALASGRIASTAPVAVSSNMSQTLNLQKAGYVVIGGVAYSPGNGGAKAATPGYTVAPPIPGTATPTSDGSIASTGGLTPVTSPPPVTPLRPANYRPGW